MRLLVLGVSALALGACSVGGGYSWDRGGFGAHQQGPNHSYQHGQYGLQQAHGAQSYGGYGYAAGSPCAPQISTCDAYVPPVYTPPPPPQPSPCHYDPCAASAYSVYGGHTPDPYAYGAQTQYDPAYGGHAYHAAPGPSFGHSNRLYGSLGAVMYDVEDDAFGLQGRLGYVIAPPNPSTYVPSFAAEVEGSVGLIDASDTITIPASGGNPATTTTLDAGVDYSVGIFGVARLPINPQISAFGRFGYHKTELSLKETVNDVVTSDVSSGTDGIAYGGGIEFAVSPVDAIRADFTRYDVGSGLELDTVSVAYQRRF